jgi:hypothetical protein
MIQLELLSPLTPIDKYIHTHTKYSSFTMYTVDDKTLADGIPIRMRNSIHTQQEKKKKKKEC